MTTINTKATQYEPETARIIADSYDRLSGRDGIGHLHFAYDTALGYSQISIHNKEDVFLGWM